MLKKSTISPESKLFSLIVSNFLDSNDDDCESDFVIIKVPESLISGTRGLKMKEIGSSGFFVYRPNEIELRKLRSARQQIQSTRIELKSLKSVLEVETDEAIDEAHRIYMRRLHRYNEAKDLAQALLGKLAHLKGKTTKELYPEFDLNLED